ncbi:hypothetical protein SDC9_80316 [bioreactor metagenome]|uniref:Uncharacterized protein n=1 Tax=bioreactor metagenome TaxID=1076179 RepID=A0A644Z0B8_9ZZZZ
MNTFRNLFQSLGSVVNGIERGHSCQQCLSSTNIGRGLFALDVLFPCLQGHAQCILAVNVFRYANDPPRHTAFILITRSKKSSRRTTEKHGNSKSLAAAESNISSPLARRCQQYERHQVRGNSHFAIRCVCFFHKTPVIFHISVAVGILYDDAKIFFLRIETFVIPHFNFDACHSHSRA